MTWRRSLSALVVLLGVAGCTKEDSLVLLDLRSSGPLGAPVAHIRLSAKGWPTRTIDGTIDAAGLRVGYYGPGDGSAVSVTAEALTAEAMDGSTCVLGSGTATVPGLKAGAISAPTTLFVRPAPANRCVPDTGTPDAGEDAGEDAGSDAGADTGADTPVDEGVDTGAEVDAGVDAPEEAGTDATPDAGTIDADDDAAVD